MSIEDIRFSQTRTFGNHLYRREGEIAEIIFENTKTGVRKAIVDDSGKIMGFPGIAHPDLISLYCEEYLGEQIRFYSHISLLDGQYALIWQIQPDGRYWDDEDGFGGTSDNEIDLYAHIDEAGNFIEPFRLFSVGSNRFYGTDEEEKAAHTLARRDDPLSCLRKHIPQMLDVMREKIKIPKFGGVCYSIPGTIYQAELSLDQVWDKWFVQARMRKRNSDTSLVIGIESLPLDEQREYLNTAKAREDVEKKLTQLFYDIQRED